VADGAGDAATGDALDAEFDGAGTALADRDCDDESETTLLELPQAERAEDKARMGRIQKAEQKLR